MKSSMVLWIISLIPNNVVRYIGLALLSAWFMIFSVRRQHPSAKMEQLENSIKKTEEILEHARLNCARKHLDLADIGSRLLQ
jgi:hypothetical protein